MMAALLLLFGIVFTALTEKGQAYPSGAPESTCYTMHPKHSNTARQTSPMPYDIQFTPPIFSEDGEITIVVTPKDGKRAIKGIQMAARRTTGNLEEFEGQFTSFDSTKVKAFSCFGGYHNMITHNNSNGVNRIEVKWKAPRYHVGNVIFRTTVVEDYSTFWVAESKTIRVANQRAAVAPRYPARILSSMVNDTDFSSCGDTKGCFFYPRFCDGHNCLVAASYEYRNKTNDYQMQLFTSSGPDYVALALSDDEDMGNDFTMACVASLDHSIDHMSVQQGLNPGRWNELQFTRSISNLKVANKDGDIHCSFVVSSLPQAYVINQTSGADENVDFDLDDSWYLMMAWGNTLEASDVISQHQERPTVSYSRVRMDDKTNSYGTVFHLMVKLHGSFMIVAWVLLSGTAIIIARHFQDLLPNRRYCSTKIWFQIHRTLAILVAALTIAGFTIIFVHFGTGIRDSAGNHAYFGIAVLSGVCLQVILGILHPARTARIRPLFRWTHGLLGHATHILSGGWMMRGGTGRHLRLGGDVWHHLSSTLQLYFESLGFSPLSKIESVTMFSAFDIDHFSSDLRRLGFISLGAWSAGQLLWNIIFEVYKCCQSRRKDDHEEYDLDEMGVPIKEKQRSSTLHNLLLAGYIFTFLAFTAAIMTVFLMY